METTKRCPYCGEEIFAVAKKCKHCGEWLNDVSKELIRCSVCGEKVEKGLDNCPICSETLHASHHALNIEENTKDCIVCGKQILDIAKKCRYCQEWQNQTVEKKEYLVCSHCGEQVKKGELFCPHCDELIEENKKDIPSETVGSALIADNELKVKDSDIEEDQVADKKDAVNAVPTKPKEKHDTRIVWIAFIVFAFLLTIFISKTCGNGDKANSEVEIQTPQTSDYSSSYNSPSYNSAVSSTNDEELKTEVRERVEKIYNDVLEAQGTRDIELMIVYFSKDFYDTYSAAIAKSANTGTVILDHNIWVQSQNWSNPKAEIGTIAIVHPSIGVHITIKDYYSTNSYSNTEFTLIMTKENGEWVIDDIRKEGNSEKNRLRDYINGKSIHPEPSTPNDNNRNNANSIWEYGYLQNEFGESMRNCPYLYGEIENGDEYFTFRVSDCEGIIVGYHRMFDSMDLIEASKLSIKAQNGQIYRFDFIKRNSSLYITDQDQMKTFLNLLIQGHFIMSVGFPSGNAYILRVNDETCDIQRVWESFNNKI